MSHYLDDPEMTAETIVDGWLMTGDLGRFDSSGHLQLFGRKKNMIVTEEGKNIYPEDIENVFEGLPVKEFCVFAANYLWPDRTMVGEQLILVIISSRGGTDERRCRAIDQRNQSPAELQAHQRLSPVGSGFSSHRVLKLSAASWPSRCKPLSARLWSRCDATTPPRGARAREARFQRSLIPRRAADARQTRSGRRCERVRDLESRSEVASHAAGEATQLGAQGLRSGFRNFLAVGGDGTAYEIVNGFFPAWR